MADVQFVGPFEYHEVVVNGHAVPYLLATPTETGVHLTLDRRFGIDLTHAEALEVVPFLADCIAIASGYSCFPCDEAPSPRRLPPWRRSTSLADVLLEDGDY